MSATNIHGEGDLVHGDFSFLYIAFDVSLEHPNGDNLWRVEYINLKLRGKTLVGRDKTKSKQHINIS